MTRVVDQPVLVLNRHWQPVAVFTAGVAVATVVREMGWVIHPETYQLLDFDAWCAQAPVDARMIKTPSGGVPAPEVIVLKEYADQPRRAVSFTRRNLYRRDEHACQYCGRQPGREALTIDHVLPRSRGGPTSWENCVVSCEPCNRRKANRTPGEARMHLRSRPRKPRWKPAVSVPHEHYRSSWETFLASSAIEVVQA